MHVFEESVPCVSPRRVDGNIDSIRRFVAAREGVDSISFWRAIRVLQSPEIAATPTQGQPCLIWDRYDAFGVGSALRDLMAVETLDPDSAYTSAERQRREPVVKDGLHWFRRNFPHTFPVFCNVVPFVLLAKKGTHAGGSVSSRMGFVWLAPRSTWTAKDCSEHLYHEYIHHCLFVEDMVRTIFCHDLRALSEPRNMVVSAVRGVPRRYDQSFHSAFVVAGIVEHRARVSDFSGARSLLPQLWPCLDALVRKRELLTGNGVMQLDMLIDCALRQADGLNVRVR